MVSRTFSFNAITYYKTKHISVITDSSRNIERDYARRVVAELYEIESVHKFRVFIKHWSKKMPVTETYFWTV